MRFMMIVKSGTDCEAGKELSREAITALVKYTEELRQAGALVELTRLEPSSTGARVKINGEKRTVTDGPFAETKELIGGYWIIDVKSKQEALEWAKRIPNPHGQGVESEIEIRQILQVDVIATGRMDRRAEEGKEFSKTAK
ncbi:MAG TPA: YciI family protein [Candidatus Acidoferrales bacterium]|nr:YciI family protein [Candidatus Acidoferrales bacterium]